jgi:hypothetical protein
MSLKAMSIIPLKKCAMMCLLLIASVAHAEEASRPLDEFQDPSVWRVIASTQVSGKIRSIADADRTALCLDYDFNGVSGYVGLQRDVELNYPENYRFDFRLRGESPDNDFQFKLIDASGDNVWWVNRPKHRYPKQWTPMRYKRRHIVKAWGPGADPELRASAKLEFTIANNVGGRGSVCFSDLRFTLLPPDPAVPNIAAVEAGSASRDAAKAADGDSATRWRSGPGVSQRLTLDLGRTTEYGGLRIDWADGLYASSYRVLASDDGRDWRVMREVEAANGGRDWVALPESESRYLALEMREGVGRGYALSEVGVEPLAFAGTPNDFVIGVAKDQPRGHFPRGFSGEQPYWTILGVDGGIEQGLIGEDGEVEVSKAGFSIAPVVLVDGRTLTWADVAVAQSLQDDDLPIPSVDWTHADAELRVTAFAEGTLERSQLLVRYRLRNPATIARDLTLALAIQPFQVNPPRQFLNVAGGISRIERLAIDGATVDVDGRLRVFAYPAPDAAFASAFDSGMAISHLSGDTILPKTTHIDDPTGLASGAMLYRAHLAPGEMRDILLAIPLTGEPLCTGADCDAERSQTQVAQRWRQVLDTTRVDVPQAGKALADSMRTALAHILVSRIGPRLQPGTRAYARSWIRDGAMISEGLLRLGRPQPVRDYLQWYAPHQFENGKVPCCVDDRGADPVPENDSHGELMFAIAEYARFTGDDAFLETMWPHVRGAFDYMEVLRASERTEANRALDPAFYGMMPASISHEGYSAKPMHSYWDNFWALRGYKDAVWVAQRLGKREDLARMIAARDQFREDLKTSVLNATARHRIDYLPGAAELGDFDPTSTTIALAPVGEQHWLPQHLLHGTFERYWREFVQRRDGDREWQHYTPYEWRNVGAFVRLGWRERAWEATRFFLDDRAPRAWNQWGEVVSRTPRSPFFLGDLPHAWVASDFLRSALDMFAYAREADDSLVLAAGIPADWFDEGVAIDGLHLPQGRLRYSLRRDGEHLRLDLGEGIVLPAGGAVLPWPYRDRAPGKTSIDGKAAIWRDGELKIEHAPATVLIKIR